MDSNKIYVAIGEDVEERESTLRWVLNGFMEYTICVIYVHVPAKRIPLPSGLELPVRLVRKNELEAFRAQETEKVLQILDDCIKMCAVLRVSCQTTFVEKDSITEGILELIYQLRIQKLVMGAAANHKYWRGMTKLRSRKATNVLQFAPDFCHVWFICKEHLIYKRESVLEQSVMEQSLYTEEMLPNSSEIDNQSDFGIPFSQEPLTHLRHSVLCDHERSPVKPGQSSTVSYSQSLSGIILPVSSFVNEDFTEQHVAEFSNVPQSRNQHLGSSSPSAKPVESPCYEELRLKKVMKEEAANMKKMLSKVSLKLTEALSHKMSLERQVEKCHLKLENLERKLFSEMALSQKYKNERYKLQIEHDGVLREIQELKQPQRFLFEFPYFELQKATNCFDPSLKIGEGGCGSMYKGFLHHNNVAIKLLAPNCVQNHREFVEQVSCLSNLRHANIVILMGACREPWALVYEYLPGGTLEDRPALPWQMRIRIAMDICSALIFLHSTQPTGISHCDLSPKKLLLDANLTCKITDFSLLKKDTKSMKLELDVYSYGILVLYLLTGKQAALGIVKEVECALKIGALNSILDPLAGDCSYVQAEQLAHMALRCCSTNRNDCPDLASDVWRVLAPMRASCSSLSSFLLASPDQPPDCFICPILQEIMEDPHFAADGFTYEAEAIKGWLESGHDTSPMTNMNLANLNLIPNRALRWFRTSCTFSQEK
ncbi:U-box domain-containing protein 33-like isoform X3 [Silene latifolia]|uniref:U-box domain-containing protein 33-like isoform X3 n=1 Tax=Silene latifolia TaxID=37657 RepID=UPI003D782977